MKGFTSYLSKDDEGVANPTGFSLYGAGQNVLLASSATNNTDLKDGASAAKLF